MNFRCILPFSRWTDRLSFIPLFPPLQSADRWENDHGCYLSVWPHLIAMVMVKMIVLVMVMIPSTIPLQFENQNTFSFVLGSDFCIPDSIIDDTVIFLTKLQQDSGHSQPLPYSPSWVVFRPNVLVDARTGDIFVLNQLWHKMLFPCSYFSHVEAYPWPHNPHLLVVLYTREKHSLKRRSHVAPCAEAGSCPGRPTHHCQAAASQVSDLSVRRVFFLKFVSRRIFTVPAMKYL